MIRHKNKKIIIFISLSLILFSPLVIPFISFAEIESPTLDWEVPLSCWDFDILGENSEGKLIIAQHKEDYSRTISKFDSDGTETLNTTIPRYYGYGPLNGSDWSLSLRRIEKSIIFENTTTAVCVIENITVNALDKDFNEFSGNISVEDFQVERCLYDNQILTLNGNLYYCDNIMEYNSDLEIWEYAGKTYIYKKKVEFITKTNGEQTYNELVTTNLWNISFSDLRFMTTAYETTNGNTFMYTSNSADEIYELFLLDSNTGETKWVKSFDKRSQNLCHVADKILILYYEGERQHSPMILEIYDENKNKIWDHKVAINNDRLYLGGLKSKGDKIIYVKYDQSTENGTIDYGIYVLNDKGILQTQLEWMNIDALLLFSIRETYVEAENSFYFAKWDNPIVPGMKFYKYSFEEITKVGNPVSFLLVLFTLSLVSVIRLKTKKIGKL